MYIRTHFSVSSLRNCLSQAAVCVRTSRKYPQSGYFLVLHKIRATSYPSNGEEVMFSIRNAFMVVVIIQLVNIYISCKEKKFK